jgi:hypothetical protein
MDMKRKAVELGLGIGLALVTALQLSPVRAQTPFAVPAPSEASTLDWLLSGRSAAPSGELPLWRSDDGFFELSLREGGALLLQSAAAPQPRRFSQAAPGDGGLLVLRLPAALPAQFGLSAGFDAFPYMPCQITLGASLCLDHAHPAERLQRAHLGAEMGGGDWQIDLRYAHLRLQGGADASLLDPGALWWLPASAEAGYPDSLTRWRGQELALSSRFFSWDAVDALTIGLSLGQWRMLPGPFNPLDDLETATLSFGLSRGALSGEISSRLVHSDPLGQSQYWAGLDVGVSWRMPWQGEFQFGARNLIIRSQPALQPSPAGARDEVTARTPYVRYHQDF